MEKEKWIRMAADYVDTAEENRVQAQDAIKPELAGMRMFEAPVIVFGSADDPLFARIQKPEAVGAHFTASRPNRSHNRSTQLSIFSHFCCVRTSAKKLICCPLSMPTRSHARTPRARSGRVKLYFV